MLLVNRKCKIEIKSFIIVRPHSLMNTMRGIAMAIPCVLPIHPYVSIVCTYVCLSVCLTVRLSYAGIESKRLNVSSSKFFYRRIFHSHHPSFVTSHH